MKFKTVTSRLLKVVVVIAMIFSAIAINDYIASAEAGLNISFSFYNANNERADVSGTFYAFVTNLDNSDRITKTINVQDGEGIVAVSQIYDQNGGSIHDLTDGNYSIVLATKKNQDITETTRYDLNNVNTINNGDKILGEFVVSKPENITYNKNNTNVYNITATSMGTTPYSHSSIISALGRTIEFGTFAKNYTQGADTESTVAAENATINADYGFSNNNFQFVNNTLTVSKTYTKNGQPVANKQVEIKVYRDDINTLVGSKTGTTDGNGYFSLTFDHLTDGSYKVVEVINGQEVSSNKVVKDEDNNDVNVTFSESNPITIHTGYSNINYFTNITNSNILNKCRTPGVIVVGNSQDYNTYKSYSKTGLELIQASDSASDYRQTIDFDSTLDNLADLSKNLASATTSSDVQVYYLSANDIAKKENKFYTNGKSYIVVNVDLTGKDSHNVEGEFCIDDQKISADFGHGDQGRDTKILFNFYTNNNGVKEAYSGTLNQGSLMTGVILAPKATYNGATGNLGGTIIAETYTHNSGEIHQEKIVSSVSKSIDIGNTITTPTEAEAEISFIKVSKTFNGLSNEEINGLLNDFSITVTNKNNSSQTYTLPLSSASRNGNTFEWRLEGLPSGTYLVKESGANVDGTTHSLKVNGENATVNDKGEVEVSITATQIQLSNIERETSCNKTTWNYDFESNVIVAKLTSNEGYFVWTRVPASMKVREGIIDLINNTIKFSPTATMDKTYFFSGNIENTLNYRGGISYDGHTLKFTDTSQWAMFAVGRSEILEGTNTDISLVNSYTKPVSYQLSGTKTLTGRDLEDGEFSFVLQDEKENEIETVTNNANGSFVFSPITYTQAGTYNYRISEVAGTRGGVRYDETVKNITVKVTDNGDGTLSAVRIDEVGDIKFNNTYTASGSIQFNGTKTLTGRKLDAEEFSFVLKDEAGEEIQTVTNNANGQFQFQALKYELKDVGTHVYTVNEVKGEAYGVTYDETVKEITVEVTDNKDGTLKVESNYKDQEMQFRNSYDVVDITVNKQWMDFENKYGLRPESITVQLFADGEFIKDATIQADEDGNWTYTFEDLPQYKEGNEIEYTIQEVSIDGYVSEVSEYDPMIGGYTIVNTLDTGDVKVTKNLNEYNTTADGATFTFRVVGVYKDNEIYNNVFGLTFNGKDTQSFTVKDLPVGTVVTVTEEYSGSAYKVDGEDSVTLEVVKDDDTQNIVLAEFNNIYDGYRQGHGAINRHKANQVGYE